MTQAAKPAIQEISGTRRPRVLWVDNDAPARFPFEKRMIAAAGWETVFAADVARAAGLLEHERFDALILDQMLAGSGGMDTHLVIWGGCRLLRWLRGTDGELPLSPEEQQAFGVLGEHHPREDNRVIPAIILSAYHNEKVLKETRDASAQDREIRFLVKPVDVRQLVAFLDDVRANVATIPVSRRGDGDGDDNDDGAGDSPPTP